MNTTARILTGWITVALSFSAGNVLGGPLPGAAVAHIGVAALGQTEAASSRPEEKHRQAADLLRRAREAMAENDLKTADTLISQAEALGVQYSALSFEDTPKRVRVALEKMQKAAGSAPARPSQLFAPLNLNKKKAAPSDPFASRPKSDTPQSTSIESSPMVAPPSAEPTVPIRSTNPSVFAGGDAPTAQRAAIAPPTTDDVRMPPALGGLYSAPQSAAAGQTPAAPAAAAPVANGDSTLRQARRALAVGDLRRASDLLEQARRQPIRYELLDDTPDKVEAAIRRHQEVQAMDRSGETYRRSYSRMLMEQSESLLRWGDFDVAEELADRAGRQQVVYGPFETKPQDLIARINVVRRQSGSPSASAAAPAAAPANVGLAASMQDAAPPMSNPIADRQRTVDLVRQARAALAAGQIDQADFLARQAEQMRVPEAAFAPGEDRPGLVLLDIRQIRARQAAGTGQYPVAQAGGVGPADRTASAAVYNPAQDPTRNMQVAQVEPRGASQLQNAESVPAPPGALAAPTGDQPRGMALFQQGEAALRAHNRDRAYQCFRDAMAYSNELDPATAQRLQDHLQLLSAPASRAGAAPHSVVDETVSKQQALTRQVAMDVGHQEANARSMCEKDPKGAVALLEQARKKVETAGLDSAARDALLRRVDRSLTETKKYIEENRSRIELAEKNNRVRSDIDREHRIKYENQQKLAALVDSFNRLMDEQRFPEAELEYKRAQELMPKEPVVQQMGLRVKFVRNLANSKGIQEAKEKGFLASLIDVDKSSVPFDASNGPMQFPDPKDWNAMKKIRGKLAMEKARRRTEREIEIDKKLKTPVALSFKNTPLSQVIEQLSKLADVNMHLDAQGLAQEGIASDTPVTIEIRREIMLKSALNLILEQLHLAYVVKDEVLKITSEQMRAGQVYTVTYNVADLVMPIPNFVGSPRMGLAGALHDALGQSGMGTGASSPFGTVTTPLSVVASKDGKQNNAAINPSVLAQMAGGATGGGQGASNMPMGFGPGGLGGGNQADFDSLIDLITSTVQPTTWDAVGGPGSIARFETNLSLVVSQTQEVHEEIVDLLEQLRRMQDLQVTIEVRFITLNDNFFERIGVDFDFTIKDNTQSPVAAGFSDVVNSTSTPSVPTRVRFQNTGTAVTGLQNVGSNPASSGIFTSDLSIPFTQGSYALATPQFGGFDAAAGASLGFAILSDIEAFFFINAAQGDRRSNVLQAPKVTLFNGQQAFVSDTSQTPFVISVVPVVGDFAAAQQPVVVVLSEGTFMTVQAVVSNDRRFVRLTVVPFFSKIGDVKTFTFQGSETTTQDSARAGLLQTDSGDKFKSKSDKMTNTKTGTTVQLPTFSFVTVTTTVSVPDGGTVLLGGIKRLSEGRNEFGVPILDKVPYLNRLFKNVGIGRDTSSLMMTVTPRIIIQEEEEEKMGIQ